MLRHISCHTRKGPYSLASWSSRNERPNARSSVILSVWPPTKSDKSRAWEKVFWSGVFFAFCSRQTPEKENIMPCSSLAWLKQRLRRGVQTTYHHSDTRNTGTPLSCPNMFGVWKTGSESSPWSGAPFRRAQLYTAGARRCNLCLEESCALRLLTRRYFWTREPSLYRPAGTAENSCYHSLAMT